MKKLIEKLATLKIFPNIYLVCLFVIFCWGGLTYLNIKYQSNTDGIIVSESGSALDCNESIKIIPTDNIKTYYERDRRKQGTTLKNDICTFDKVFDQSDTDRSYLFNFTNKALDYWAVNRPDLSAHFYKKIMNANPNDALSLYIKKEKLK